MVKNLLNRRFGKLLVIKKFDGNTRETLRWLCKCDCGKEKIINYKNLLYGWTQSCGCLRFKNLSGQRFGRLVVSEQYTYGIGKKYRIIKWLCQCDCGNKKWVSSRNLTKGHTKSCGCLHRENSRRLDLNSGDASKNKCYYVYKKNAKNRKLKFELTFEEFIKTTSKTCYYCDAKPSNKIQVGEYAGEYIYNGIDRINNNKGYTLDNCVPCCWVCNVAKHKMDIREFYILIEKIYKYKNLEMQ